LLRWKLRSAECRNQGYVLDGLPVTLEQAKDIFERVGEQAQLDAGNAEGGDGEGAGDPASPEVTEAAPSDAAAEGGGGEQSPAAIAAAHTRQILSRLKPARVVQVPNRVIMINAPRELLEHRAQALADSEAEASGNTQEAFARRLEQFEAESERVADFFERRAKTKTEGDEPAVTDGESSEGANADEKESKETEESGADGVEVLELHLPSEAAFRDEHTFDEPIRTYMEQGGTGAPFNFHPTREELRQRQRELEAKQREDDDRRRREAKEHEEVEAYLMDTVLPSLTEGMLEVVKVQPEDPIDYLAEFLFRKGQEMESQAAMSSSG
jgi:adenylate kinase